MPTPFRRRDDAGEAALHGGSAPPLPPSWVSTPQAAVPPSSSQAASARPASPQNAASCQPSTSQVVATDTPAKQPAMGTAGENHAAELNSSETLMLGGCSSKPPHESVPPPSQISRTRDQLAAIAQALNVALQARWTDGGFHENVADGWSRFFADTAGANGCGMSSASVESAICGDLLGCSPSSWVTREDVRALIAVIDSGSDRVEPQQWQSHLSRLELERQSTSLTGETASQVFGDDEDSGAALKRTWSASPASPEQALEEPCEPQDTNDASMAEAATAEASQCAAEAPAKVADPCAAEDDMLEAGAAESSHCESAAPEGAEQREAGHELLDVAAADASQCVAEAPVVAEPSMAGNVAATADASQRPADPPEIAVPNTAVDDTAGSTTLSLKVGRHVVLHNLKTADFNGQEGVIIDLHEAKGRWCVLLSDGSVRAFKAENLEAKALVEDNEAAATAPDEPCSQESQAYPGIGEAQGLEHGDIAALEQHTMLDTADEVARDSSRAAEADCLTPGEFAVRAAEADCSAAGCNAATALETHDSTVEELAEDGADDFERREPAAETGEVHDDAGAQPQPQEAVKQESADAGQQQEEPAQGKPEEEEEDGFGMFRETARDEFLRSPMAVAVAVEQAAEAVAMAARVCSPGSAVPTPLRAAPSSWGAMDEKTRGEAEFVAPGENAAEALAPATAAEAAPTAAAAATTAAAAAAIAVASVLSVAAAAQAATPAAVPTPAAPAPAATPTPGAAPTPAAAAQDAATGTAAAPSAVASAPAFTQASADASAATSPSAPPVARSQTASTPSTSSRLRLRGKRPPSAAVAAPAAKRSPASSSSSASPSAVKSEPGHADAGSGSIPETQPCVASGSQSKREVKTEPKPTSKAALRARELGHTFRPKELGCRVAVIGDGWGNGEGGYEAVVTEADNLTFTVVSIGGWEETHVLRSACIPVSNPSGPASATSSGQRSAAPRSSAGGRGVVGRTGGRKAVAASGGSTPKRPKEAPSRVASSAKKLRQGRGPLDAKAAGAAGA